MNSFDQSLHQSILGMRSSTWNEVFLSLTHLGDKEIVLLLTAFLAIGGWIAGLRLRPFGLIALVCLAMGTSEVIKKTVKRDRPFIVHKETLEILPGTVMPDPESYSFPSGHATLSAALFVGGALVAPNMSRSKRLRLAVLGLIVTFLVGFSRVYLGLHWPTDVFTGWAIGIGWGLIAAWVLDRFGPEREGPAGTFNQIRPV